MTEREALILLNTIEGVGPVGVRTLSERLGSAAAILVASREALSPARWGARTMDAVAAARDGGRLAAELEQAEAAGARLVTPVDEEYPRRLRAIHDPPLALYVQGSLQLRDERAIALVGTRRPTHYGRDMARRLAEGLARAGYTVVSGLAEGIDAEAHRAALEAGGRTIGVLGGGLDKFFPPSNRELAAKMSAQGAVLTEFPFGRSPGKETFPMRNRIVSGMTVGTVVVEANSGSGALITARMAGEQGRTVFAVPGRADVSAAAGCLALIRDGAVLVRHVEDVLEEFDLLIPRAAREAPAAPAPELTAEERALVAGLAEGGMDVDALVRRTGITPAAMSTALLTLELKRVVRMLPGRVVELVGK